MEQSLNSVKRNIYKYKPNRIEIHLIMILIIQL